MKPTIDRTGFGSITIEGVVFDHEDQSAARILAARHFLHNQAHSVVIVGHLRFHGVDAVDGVFEIAEVIVGQAQ